MYFVAAHVQVTMSWLKQLIYFSSDIIYNVHYNNAFIILMTVINTITKFIDSNNIAYTMVL